MSYNFSQEELDKLHAQYQQLVDENQNLNWEQFAEKVNSLPVRHDKKEYFRHKLCAGLLYNYCTGLSHYSSRLSAGDKFWRKLFCETAEKLPQDTSRPKKRAFPHVEKFPTMIRRSNAFPTKKFLRTNLFHELKAAMKFSDSS